MQPLQVGLRRADLAMPKRTADNRYGDTLTHRIDSEAVPEPVRMNTVVYPSLHSQVGHHLADIPGRQRPTGLRMKTAEQRPAIRNARSLTRIGPDRDNGQHPAVGADRPRLTALAEPDPDRASHEIHVRQAQAQRLGAPQTTPPERGQQRVIPHP